MEYRDFESYSEPVRKAYHIALEAHRGQKDKAGVDYIYHPMTVASTVEDSESCIIAALLHDVVEDTQVSLDDLASQFSEEVVQALECLTHGDDMAYEPYVVRIAKDPIAKQVKIADLKHNMDLDRLPELSEAALERVKKKYEPAMAFLTGELSEAEYLSKPSGY